MMPPLPRVVIVLFLGLPGLVLWLGGFVSLLFASVFAVFDFWPDGLIYTTLSAGAASLGFIMFACARLMTAEQALRAPLCHLPSMIAFQLAVMISGAIALASALVTFGMLIFADWHPGAPLTAITSVCLLAALLHFHPALKEKWKPQTEEERSLDDGHPDGAIRRSDEI